MKHLAIALTLALTAPYQCGAKPQERPVEDSAPQALWVLAERFQEEGNAPARETTLRQLVDRYPSSRYAQRAREELGMPNPQGSEGDEDPEEGEK